MNEKGVGLGLNLSNQMAFTVSSQSKKTGIQVSSEFGKGSVFCFWVHNYFDNKIMLEIFKNKSPTVKAQNDIIDRVDKLDE